MLGVQAHILVLINLVNPTYHKYYTFQVFSSYGLEISGLVEGTKSFVTARIRRMGEGNVLTRVCPSVCPQGGGGVGQPGGGVGQVQWGGGVGQVQPGGRGGSGPAGGGGVGQPWGGGVGQLWGGGVGQWGEGWVSHGGRGGSAGGEGWVRSSGGVRSSWGGEGWVRSSQGGGVGQVQPGGRGGSGPAGGEGVGQVQPGGGSAKIAQHRKYLLHGGRYASCVHAGGLSCSI